MCLNYDCPKFIKQISHSYIDSRTDGKTLLHLACENVDSMWKIPHLLKYDASVFCRDINGHTPLHCLFKQPYIDLDSKQRYNDTIVQCLVDIISYEPDVSCVTRDYNNVVHLILMSPLLTDERMNDCLEIVIKKGAYVHQRNAMGQYPIDIIRLRQFTHINDKHSNVLKIV